MAKLNAVLSQNKSYNEIRRCLEKNITPQLIVGLSAVGKSHFIGSLCEDTNEQVLLITHDEATAFRMTDDINEMFGQDTALFYPVRDLVFIDAEGISREYEHTRLSVLGKIIEKKAKIVVASVEAAALYTIPPNVYADYSLGLKVGGEYDITKITNFLVGAGYVKESQVDGISQFALRGGILDIYPATAKQPYRIEFWGDEIDTISTFDVESQRRNEAVDEIEIAPIKEAIITNPLTLIKTLENLSKTISGKHGKAAKENIKSCIEKLDNGLFPDSADKFLPILYENKVSLFDYCSDRVQFFCEPISIKDNANAFHKTLDEDIKVLFEGGTLFPGCDNFAIRYDSIVHQMNGKNVVFMDTFARSLGEIKIAEMQSIDFVQLSSWSGNYNILKEDIDDLFSDNYSVVIFGGTERAVKSIKSDLVNDGIRVLDRLEDGKSQPKTVTLLEGSISAGLKYPSTGIAIITHNKAMSKDKKASRRHKAGKKVREISDLNIGDFVVHASHGIGVFGGIVKRSIHSVTKDFIKIRYRGTDELFVPVTQLDLVSKYMGAAEGNNVKLNRLNSVEWQNTKTRVKSAVKEMAKELTELYARRMKTNGYAFSKDSDWQAEFEERFPYDETDDQLQSVREIKSDMERALPMDRLLCGDVGFGKTEVAVRAAFKAVLDGKQVAFLVPTTILAWQHYQTFLSRFTGYPIKIEMLSRFRTPKQQKEIMARVTDGTVDIVIGTHRIVQKDIVFKNLGLCVIDEEQRFGVAHKEHFKTVNVGIDILTLSATPIPRTLNMAMTGIRDMSVLEQPPVNRHPVQTYVTEYQEGIIAQAIQKELRRGGQVFYLHNNTNTIDRCAYKLGEILPEDTRIVVAHGKMGEKELSEIWRQLVENEIDILVCTTIIETGVDVPNANTLIIEDAENYGLSQLYQLRGRVGRSNRRAYAYFTFRKDKALSEIASKRLSAIREFTAFGSGFQIAMRDLEIRGAGSILGAKQHGHMEAVGYEMYLQLLEEAVAEQTGKTYTPPSECLIDIQLDAYIPETYISNSSQRIEIYKSISQVGTSEDALEVTDELIDRFGDPPRSVAGLIEVALIRGQASKFGIEEIRQSGDKMLFYVKNFSPERAAEIAGAAGGRIKVSPGVRSYFSLKMSKSESPLTSIKNFFNLIPTA